MINAKCALDENIINKYVEGLGFIPAFFAFT